MEIGEMIAVGFISDRLEKCPFGETVKPESISFEAESIKFDDKKAAVREQENDGGKLGKNLQKGSNGAKGTIGGDYAPDTYKFTSQPNDTKRPAKPGKKPMAFVPGADETDGGTYPFMVAAHHLIPGEASLYSSLLARYLTEGKTVSTTNNKKWKIKNHIGYNVNGCHNGIWLVGNYAIRPPESATQTWLATPETGVSWGALSNQQWCLSYAAAAMKVTGAQFHDAHTQYSEAVKKLLNKITAKLHAHQLHCEECEGKLGKDIAPPYFVKERLYNLSNYLRGQLGGNPLGWKRPWFASDKWRDKVFSGARLNENFVESYQKARLVD